ncbi:MULTISPECIES: site-specific integrase [unclassified Marinobacter]|jgi:integrase|uniref:tyrosine-type recombinase/integrase n=1 Tax=unclassified Marinobacter TaxID=83889 RepID=UPI00200F716C|nr:MULTISPECIES: site-specific integrase [unclassified Marinobacter]MCL1488439.1 integrase arm-type DNA-binding domain-containing protein [Marinobacter sp.]UQG57133.1 integrase arm-type DNA-binding domain-containing protein [Marinobacter sp. M4C]UQG65937.1 integrase arm-type DNA-binding domain-containing protein [Marinobacter sp. M2C]UQG70217.1 integrase arm-type DNA-binding domain-containing protein [Marinobacter sp. M1C]
MPKKTKEMSAAEVKRLAHSTSKTGKEYNALHSVGGVSGLLLQVTPTGAKSWIYRTTIGTKRRSIGLGGYPDVTLAQARDTAREYRELIRSGIDPIEQRQQARIGLVTAQLARITFDDAAVKYIAEKAKEFKNPRQRKHWENSLATYASPVIGKLPVSQIDLALVKAVLEPIWTTKTDTATRVRARIEAILGWAAVHGYRSEENPARWRGYLDKVLPSPTKIAKKSHFEAMASAEIPQFFQELQKRRGNAARALEFLILTASRTNEVIGDRAINKQGVLWCEIDLKKRLWTIPTEKMKGGKLHRVPLTDQTVRLLQSVRQGVPNDSIFPGAGGEIASNNFLTSLMKRMERPYTVHGFRSTFKDWTREFTAYADEVSELALAHVNSDATRAAYARSELLDKRRQLMNDWERFCYYGKQNNNDAKIIAIGGSKS